MEQFIPRELAVVIHADLLKRYGGKAGLRDPGLLESSLSQPKMMMGGKFLHKTLFDKAAAYGFHVCQNHPFTDGNKRVAFVLMSIFLQRNGWEIKATEEEAYALMMELAKGGVTKAKLAQWLKKNCEKLGKPGTHPPY